MKSRIAWKKYFAEHPKLCSKMNPVPPSTLFKVREENPGPYRDLLGPMLRVGYYSQQDGLNVIWIVYPNGDYGETTSHSHFNRHFRITSIPEEVDYFGATRPALTALVSG